MARREEKTVAPTRVAAATTRARVPAPGAGPLKRSYPSAGSASSMSMTGMSLTTG
jgi:hypothetical protein